MNAIDFHNRIAARFHDKYQSSKAFEERFAIWTGLFERYVHSTDRVIDLGCGSGIFSNYLAEKGCTVTGIDGSAAMIALCERLKTSASALYVRDSLPLAEPVRFAYQDVALMSSVLEYLVEPGEMLAQVKTLLKSNGLLIVSIPNQRSFYRVMERGIFRLTKRPAYLMHSRHVITPNVLNQQVKMLGFELLETTYFSAPDPLSWALKPFLAEQYVNNLFVGVYRKKPLYRL